MKKFCIIVFMIAAAAIAGYSIKYITTPVDTVDASIVTEEKSVSGKGIIIREEKLYNASSSGTVYNNVTEGARVAKDSLISTIYSGAVDSDVLRELHNLDKKIEKEAKMDNSYSPAYISVENEIASLSSSVIQAAAKNDITSIVQYKQDINSLRAGKSVTAEDRLKDLNSERGNLELSISSNKTEVYADMSGIFTTYLDGLENVLNPSLIENYAPNFMNDLNLGGRENKSASAVNAGDPVCKIMNNHVWYVLMAVPEKKLENIKKNTQVSMRFKNMANEKLNGKISYIGNADENGNALVLVKFSTYFESAFSRREVETDLIFESHEGYKIPVSAIYTNENGGYHVIGEIGKTQYKCQCDILYTDTESDFVIIDSSEDAENKLSRMDRIVIGER